MDTITLTAVVGEDRRLVIDLPPDAPTGPIEVTIRAATPQPEKQLTREEARARLRAAGVFVLGAALALVILGVWAVSRSQRRDI